MATITFLPMNKTVTVPEGTSILEAALENDIPLGHECGGNCICATCHVYAISGREHLTAMDDLEDSRLDDVINREAKSRLACQARIAGENSFIVVQLP